MNFLLFLQNLRLASAGIFDSLMLTITELGQSLITFLLLAFVYWCVDKRAGQLMAFNVSFGCWFNQWIKKVFRIERPWIRDARIKPVNDAVAGATGYSFPSGHTQRSVATWGALGFSQLKAKKKTGFYSIALVLMIMFSRNYLGVHTFSDVLVALVIGTLLIILFNFILDWVDKGKNGFRDILVVTVGCILLFIPMVKFGCLSNAGAGYGFLIGWLLERRFVDFKIDAEEKIGVKILRFIPGAIVVFICFTSGTSIMGHIFPEKYAGFFNQLIASFFIIFFYPLVLKVWDERRDTSKKVLRRVLCVFLAVVMLAFIILGIARTASHYGEFAGNALVDEGLTSSIDIGTSEQSSESIGDSIVDGVMSEGLEASNCESIKPVVIAHRGYSGIAPENTISSFERAIDIGADYIELDVQLTSDGEIVVFHDTDMARITGVPGQISEHTYEEISMLDAGSWFAMPNTGMSASGRSTNYAGEKIPKLSEVFDLIKNSEVKVYLELKDITGAIGLSQNQLDAFATMVVDKVDEYGMGDRVIYASFNYDYLKQIKEINASNQILLNTSSGDGEYLIANYPADYYGLNINNLQQDTIDIVHQNGRGAYIWTVNTPEQMINVVSLGADGICTNYPGVASVVVHDEYSYLADNFVGSITVPGIYDYQMSDRLITSIDDYRADGYEGWQQYTTFVNQGLTKVGNYLLVSAYDSAKEKNSIIYVMDTNGNLINTVDLGFMAHTGGIAYDEARDILWVCAASGYVNAISASGIISGTYQGLPEEIIYSFDAGLVNHNDSHVASFLAFDAGKLYVGSYCDGMTGKLNEYVIITETNNSYEVSLVGQYIIPERIQGATFAHDGKTNTRTLIMTQSHNIDDSSLLKVSFDPNRLDYTAIDEAFTLPEGAEQPLMTANGLYLLFESSARVYRYDARCVSDQIWVVK